MQILKNSSRDLSLLRCSEQSETSKGAAACSPVRHGHATCMAVSNHQLNVYKNRIRLTERKAMELDPQSSERLSIRFYSSGDNQPTAMASAASEFNSQQRGCHDSLHNADVLLLSLKVRPLLDVQLHKSSDAFRILQECLVSILLHVMPNEATSHLPHERHTFVGAFGASCMHSFRTACAAEGTAEDRACAVAAEKPTALAASLKLDPLSSLNVSSTLGSKKPVMPWLQSNQATHTSILSIQESQARPWAGLSKRMPQHSSTDLLAVVSVRMCAMGIRQCRS